MRALEILTRVLAWLTRPLGPGDRAKSLEGSLAPAPVRVRHWRRFMQDGFHAPAGIWPAAHERFTNAKQT